jgi:glycerophosphoryl diester phosphodiesterase
MSIAAALLSAGLFMTGFALCDEEVACTRIGHRGAPVSAPENTVASVRAAIAAGVDAVEFDVKFTADRKLIVIYRAMKRLLGLGVDAIITDDPPLLNATLASHDKSR